MNTQAAFHDMNDEFAIVLEMVDWVGLLNDERYTMQQNFLKLSKQERAALISRFTISNSCQQIELLESLSHGTSIKCTDYLHSLKQWG